MQSKTVHVLTLLILGSISALADEDQREFETLQLKYGIAAETLTKPMESLRKQYKERLAEIMESYTQKGDLENVLAARSAIAAGDPVPEKVDQNP